MDNEKTMTLNELAERIRELAITSRVLEAFSNGDLDETWHAIDQALCARVTEYVAGGGKFAG